MGRSIHGITIAAAMACWMAPAWAGDTASVRQEGVNGTATIEQLGNLGDAFAAIVQGGGFGNGAAITQSGLILAQGVRLGTAIVNQTGERNFTSVEQRGLGRMDAQVSQDGDFNRASISQINADASARVSQAGVQNLADIAQARTFGAEVLLGQEGSDNSATVRQHDGSFLHVDISMTGNGNLANIDQSGFNDQLSIQQTGGNALAVTQEGIGPEPVSASILQTGVVNAATVIQVGSGSSASIAQPGAANTATIRQHF